MEVASGLNTEYQSSEQYDTASAEPAVSATLSPSTRNARAFTEPSFDTSQSNAFVPDTAFQSLPDIPFTADPSTDQQSKSRSMSADSSSDSDPEIITLQTTQPTLPNGTLGGAVSHTNGVSISMSQPASNVLITVDHSESVHPDNAVQGRESSKVPASPFPDGTIDVPVDTPPQNDLITSMNAAEDATPQASTSSGIPLPKARLPHDKLGMLEDRIKDDPRGDVGAWIELIDEHKRRDKLEDARSCYERFFAVFPFAAEVWLSYAQMENNANNRNLLDNVLGKSLMQVPYLPLWSLYLDHVRRHNNVMTDITGDARKTIHQAYDLALHQVGLDKDSGRLWQDYVLFIKSGPGIIGGSSWQDQQKMDLLRKTYQQAICVPNQATNTLWKEYDGFEMGLNKTTGRKFLQDQSPAYMSARSSYTELQNITRNVRRTTLPSLPPAPGFDGEAEYMEQLDIWKHWIQWEKDDPLVLKQDDLDAFKSRVLFVYKHALMAMRFWPELWYDASEFCFANGMDNEGNDFLLQGVSANPESCLLAFKRADRLESSTAGEEGDEKTLRRAAAVREPFDMVLDALYGLIEKSKSRQQLEIAQIEASFLIDIADQQVNGVEAGSKEEDEEEPREDQLKRKEEQKLTQIEVIKREQKAEADLLSTTISHVWIALMRALRRIQGKGNVNAGGARGVFSDARKRGRITSDVYIQAALIEFHCYEPDTGRKIFERGLKLFQEDESFALEYIKHLVANNDHTNARVVFETVVNRLSSKPDTIGKAKSLYTFFHDFECRYGELAQIIKLEKRMIDLYSEDPALSIFAQRFIDKDSDATTFRPIISPATQIRPKIKPSIETTVPDVQVPLTQKSNSPKRPLPLEDSDNDMEPPRKFVRAASPIKPVVPQRVVQQNTQPQPPPPTQQFSRPPMPQPYLPPPLPRDVTYLLSIIPKADTYHATKFDSKELVRLIRETNIPNHISQLSQQAVTRGMPLPGPPPPHHIPPPHMQPTPQPYPQHGSVPPMQQRPGMPPMPQMPPVGYGGYSAQPVPYVYGR